MQHFLENNKRDKKVDIAKVRYLIIDIVDELKKDNDVLAVFLRGSITEGYATLLSDIDIGVITQHKRQERKFFRGNLPFHIRFYPKDEVEKAFSDMTRGRILYILRHIQNALILYEKNNYLTELRCKLKTLEPPRKMMKEIFLKGYPALIDAWASYIRGDFESAILDARRSVMEVAPALLLSKKILNIKQKWLLEGLRKLDNQYPEVTKLFREVHGISQVSKDKAKETIFSALAFIYVISKLLNIKADMRGIIDENLISREKFEDKVARSLLWDDRKFRSICRRLKDENYVLEFKRILKGIIKDNNNPREIAEMVFRYVKKTIKPEKQTEWKEPEEILAERKGDCKGQSILLYTLFKAYGLNPYLVIGLIKIFHHRLRPAFHAWVEININGKILIYDPAWRRANHGIDKEEFYKKRKGYIIIAKF